MRRVERTRGIGVGQAPHSRRREQLGGVRRGGESADRTRGDRHALDEAHETIPPRDARADAAHDGVRDRVHPVGPLLRP